MLSEITQRSKDIVGDINNKVVGILGLGSVGSAVADLLVRNGVINLIVFDIDVVEISNIGRTTYSMDDVGLRKTDALSRKLKSINPLLNIRNVDENIVENPSSFIKVFEHMDIVVCCTDDPKANRIISRISYCLGKVAVFIGIYDKARGGEIIITGKFNSSNCSNIPCIDDECYNTPCYECCRGRKEEGPSSINYGTGKLEAVSALSSDIMTIVSLGSRISISLICNSGELEHFGTNIILNRATYVRISMSHDELLRVSGSSGDMEYCYKYMWTVPHKQIHNNKQRMTCNICGPNPTSIYQYVWKPNIQLTEFQLIQKE